VFRRSQRSLHGGVARVLKAPLVWCKRPFFPLFFFSLSTSKFMPLMQNFSATPSLYFFFTFGTISFFF
jgi:hypothetical protein